ncbi:MAG: OmpA family protein [Bacteroidia bacterium]|nr:OmpA family protein [Bacteroidia bacterium]
MRSRRILFILLFVGFFCGISASATSQSRLQRADRYYNTYQYAMAAKMYRKAAKGKKKEEALFKLAECYRMMNNYKEAEAVYSRLVNMKTLNPKVYYHYAEMLLHNKKYDEAGEQLRTYLALVPSDEKGKLLLRSSDEMKAWKVQTAAYKVYPLKDLNTSLSEYSPVIFGEGLVYASESKLDLVSGGANQWNGNPNLVVFYSKGKRSGDSTVYGNGTPLSVLFNNESQNGPIAFAPDGKEACYCKVNNQKKKGKEFTNRPKLFFVTMNGNRPGEPVPFEYNSDDYSVGHPAYSNDGNILFFVSDMPGGMGGKDIWMCKRESGGWGKPVNLGAPVNTKGDETFPGCGPDGVLYFSSSGHIGFGGLDIFSTHLKEGKWESPANLQYPVNTASDDFGMCFRDKNRGYFTSNRPGAGGDDIYGFYRIAEISNVSGKILLTKNIKDAAANVQVALLNDKKEVLQTTVTDEFGYFRFDHVPSNKNYMVMIESDDPTQLKDKYYLADNQNRIVKKTVVGQKGLFVFELLPSDLTKLPKLVEEDAFVSIAGSLLVGEEKMPLSNTSVNVKNEKGELIQTTTTNSFGAFVFTDLPTDDNYLLMIEEKDADLNGKKIYFVNKSGKEVAVSQGGFKYKLIHSDKTSLSLLIVKDEDLRIDLKGKILGDNKTPLTNTKVLVVNEKGEVVQTAITDGKGDFVFVSLPADKKYLVQIDEKDAQVLNFKNLVVVDEKGKVLGNFHLFSGKFKWEMLPTEQKTLASIYVDDPWLQVQKLKSNTEKKDTITIIENIYYEYDKWDLLPEARIVLDKVVQVMKMNPGITIEIYAHTDSRSSTDYNQKLSEKRAKAAADYIASKGIDKKRLTSKGMGEQKVLNKCKDGVECTEDEHAKNRRTEFKIQTKK